LTAGAGRCQLRPVKTFTLTLLCAAIVALPLALLPAEAQEGAPPALTLGPQWPLADTGLSAATTPTATPAPQVIVVQQPAITAPENYWEGKVAAVLAIGTTLVLGISALAALAIRKITELVPEVAKLLQAMGEVKERQNRQSGKIDAIQKQVTEVALAAPPPTGGTGTGTGIARLAILGALLATSMASSGCSAMSASEKAAWGATGRRAVDTALLLGGAFARASLQDPNQQGFAK
jgi:hypothetical protein